MKKILTISIGIPAHNEEKSIRGLLNQLLAQKIVSGKLCEILVVCDGCTDKTADIVKEVAKNHPVVKLRDDGKRTGKAGRINQILSTHKGDIVLCLDADVDIKGNRLIESIAQIFANNPSVGLVGGNDLPAKPKSYFEKVSVVWIEHWQRVARPIHNWINPNNCHGCIYGVRKSLSRKLQIPTDITADDHYIFYTAIKNGFDFRFCPEAIVYFKTPSKFSDYVNQSIRFGKTGVKVKNHFKKFSKEYTTITKKQKVYAYIYSTLHHPVKFPLAVLIEAYIKLRIKKSRREYRNGVYDQIISSK